VAWGIRSPAIRQWLTLLAATTVALVLLGGGAAAVPATGPASPGRQYRAFGDPTPVAIEGFTDSAMEPFISYDGEYLLFNTSNVPPNVPSLQYATRLNADTFEYDGLVRGADRSGFLSGTPATDRDGTLYFVSTRSYAQTLSTIYAGQFSDGRLSDLHRVRGISGGSYGVVDFDVDVSADGRTLYVSSGDFSGGSPTTASIAVFDRAANGFVPDPRSARILRNVNTPGILTYAADVSANGLELFFTRAAPDGGAPAIYRAARGGTSRPFGPARRISAITGFVEAPSISADGTTLYYHRLVGPVFQIWEVTRG
jgi:hypothetical protein